MNTRSRLIRFGFGISLGLLLVMIIFGNRKFSYFSSYFPSGRVIESLKTKKIITVTGIPAAYQSLADTVVFKQFLNNATVNFSESDAQKKPCAEYLLQNTDIQIRVKNCEKEINILKVTEISKK